MTQDTIPNIMRKHHYLIEGVLNRLKRHEDDKAEIPKIFDKFKWELEKHFFIEEKAIFTLIDTDDQESHEMKLELIKEHRTILKDMKNMEEKLKSEQSLDISSFEHTLMKHRDFEDERFYPTLEEELPEDKKKEIIDRISNPI